MRAALLELDGQVQGPEGDLVILEVQHTLKGLDERLGQEKRGSPFNESE